MMPYHSILLLIIEPVKEGEVPYTILHPDMPISLEDLQRDWIHLKGEHDTLEAQFYASEKKVLELTRLLHEEQTLNAYIAPKRMQTTFLSLSFVLFCLRGIYVFKLYLINITCVSFCLKRT